MEAKRSAQSYHRTKDTGTYFLCIRWYHNVPRPVCVCGGDELCIIFLVLSANDGDIRAYPDSISFSGFGRFGTASRSKGP